MLTRLLKAKLHQLRVTETEVNYHGSIKIDADLLRASGMVPNEAVLCVDCENGARFETYIILGEPGSGIVGVYGAAALLTRPGNRLIVMAWALATPAEAATHTSRVVICDAANRVIERVEAPSVLP